MENAEIKHTPKPWRIRPGAHIVGYTYNGDPLQIVGGDGLYVAKVDAVEKGAYNEPRNLANARLMIAAPELFEACESLPLEMLDREDSIDAAEFVDRSSQFLKAMRKARAAVAKARKGTDGNDR